MTRAFFAIVLFFIMTVRAVAQDTFWVQIEARQTLTSAQEKAREYARRLDNVSGFYIGNGFYGILIGPFDAQQADSTRARLLARGAIPADSFVKNGRSLRQQFWPVGGIAQSIVTTPSGPASNPTPTIPSSPPTLPDETPQQARISENALSARQRLDLQRALQWAGFYDAAIDGAFGRGTRAAMRAWQSANNVTPTGILTTRQRVALMDDYNSVLDGMNLRLVRDDASGIQMQIPTGVVAFAGYQPPFVRYETSGDVPQAMVLFISQAGDQGKLTGLYEVLQILDIVPPVGPRRLFADGFEIEGMGDDIHSYTSVTLQNGAIKGFMLVWPANDDLRRQRLIAEMRTSFERLEGVLDPRIVPPSEDQSIDMVSGLAVRQPKLSHSGFFVSQDGVVITTTQVVDGCERITIDQEYDVEVAFVDTELGIALLRPLRDLVPVDLAEFQTALPRLRDRIAVAGYPFGGILNAPTLTYGEVADIRGLTGDNRFSRLSLPSEQSDAGGPVFDETGAVLGMLLPRADNTPRVLPTGVNFALDAGQILTVLAEQGIEPSINSSATTISSVALTRRAADVAVLVSCW